MLVSRTVLALALGSSLALTACPSEEKKDDKSTKVEKKDGDKPAKAPEGETKPTEAKQPEGDAKAPEGDAKAGDAKKPEGEAKPEGDAKTK